jgi:acyl carrier protein
VEDQVKRIMADVLDLDPDAIDGSVGRDTFDGWDSQKHVTLCLALEEEFQVTFEVHEMESMMTYDDVVTILQQKLVA